MKTRSQQRPNEDIIRIGHFEFLNGYPLYYGLERGAGWSCFQMAHGVPTELNRLLLDGELDISPISSIEYAANSDRLLLFSRLSITADGAVDSIRLITSRPIGELTSVAVTSQSATSVALLKIILSQGYGIEPRYSTLEGDVAAGLAEHDGVLLIGDDALKSYYNEQWERSYDLGEEWKALTGLPMVYALWAVSRQFYDRRRDEANEVQERLLYSLEYCRGHWDEVVAAAARVYPFQPEMLHSYFAKLRYDLTDEYRLGLMEFYRRAVVAGLLDHAPDLNFI
ncbi:MAG: menaquinone biosynthetic enzyme MqnA/MqnD family protein [Thermoleophilia bacterium]